MNGSLTLTKFFVTKGTKFSYTSFIKVVLLDVEFVQKFDSHCLNE